MSLWQILKAIMQTLLITIDNNRDKLLHLSISFLLYAVAIKIVPDKAFVGIAILLIGLVWERIRMAVFSIAISKADMLANLIGVILAIIII